MANVSKLKVTELDFDNIKDNFKSFLKGQSEFTDYDLEGSGMNVLMDLLAYNTHYMAYNLNMAINESFLSRASLRSSVVSHAKVLGYVPRSSRSPVAYVNITVNDPLLNQATLQKGTVFTSTVDEIEYSFVTIETYTRSRTNGLLRFENIPIYEGSLVTNEYTVDLSNKSQKFIILSDKVDINTISVLIRENISNLNYSPYLYADSIYNIDANSEIFYLQENVDGGYEVYFGDGILGKQLQNGNIITIQYVVTNEKSANGASVFSMVGNISGSNNVTISSVINASGGDEKESIDSIKRNAPLYFSSQNRAVTVNDYKTIIPKLYTNVDSLKVWGGEDNDIPSYGNVFISIKPYNSNKLTYSQEEQVRRLLAPYNIASIRQTFVDPEITSVFLNIDFNFNDSITNKTVNDLQSIIRDNIINYSSNTLEKFDTILKYSIITDIINASDDSIVSSNLRYNLSKSFKPVLNKTEKYVLKYNNPIYHPHAGHVPVVTSTSFKIPNSNNTFFINDNGSGILRMYYILDNVNIYVNNNLGEVDYVNGTITINELNIASTTNTDNSVRLIVVPNYSDIYSIRQQILTIDKNNISISGVSDTVIRSVSNDQHGLFDSFTITTEDNFNY